MIGKFLWTIRKVLEHESSSFSHFLQKIIELKLEAANHKNLRNLLTQLDTSLFNFSKLFLFIFSDASTSAAPPPQVYLSRDALIHVFETVCKYSPLSNVLDLRVSSCILFSFRISLSI